MNKKILTGEFMVKNLHYKVLSEIDKNPGVYPSQLGRYCTYSAACHITKKLVEYGWIYFLYEKKKKRMYITAKGDKVLEMTRRIERLKE